MAEGGGTVRGAFFWAAVTALFWGLAPVVEKLGLAKVAPTVAMSVRSFTVSLLMLAYLGASGQLGRLGQVDLRSLAFIALGAVLAGLLGQLTYFLALKQGLTSSVVPVVGAYPLVAALLGFLFLGERVTLLKAAGALLIAVGVALVRLS